MIKKINQINNYFLTNRIIDMLNSIPFIKNFFKEFEYNNFDVKEGINKFLNFIGFLFKPFIRVLLLNVTYFFFKTLISELTDYTFGNYGMLYFVILQG